MAPPMPPGNENLELLGPNLHRRQRIHGSPTPPRPKRPSEAEGIGVPAGGSTRSPPFRPLNCSRTGEFGRALERRERESLSVRR